MSDADHTPRRAPRPSEPLRAPAPPGAARPARLLLPVGLCAGLVVAPFLLHRPAPAAVPGTTHVSRVADGPAARTGDRAASRSSDAPMTAAQLAALQQAAAGMVSIQSASPPVTTSGAGGSAAAAPGAGTAGSGPSTTSTSAGASDPRAEVDTPPSTTTTTVAPTTTTTEAPTTTTTVRPTTTTTAAPSHSETGSASWYQAPSGTCAHPSLPFGTVVTVTNLANGDTTQCRVEDRGPYAGGRIIDLSEATFAQIASTSDGVIQVRIEW